MTPEQKEFFGQLKEDELDIILKARLFQLIPNPDQEVIDFIIETKFLYGDWDSPNWGKVPLQAISPKAK
jgi:hypothetical protein